MKNYTIYKHTSPSGKIYIGQTCKNPKDRWSNGFGYRYNTYFFRAINKYGWNNFTHDIIIGGLTKEEADWFEKYLIDYYETTDRSKGYNLTEGGEGALGRVVSDDTKKLISLKAMGRKVPDEIRQKMSESKKKLYKEHPEKKPIPPTKYSVLSTRKPVEQLDLNEKYLKTFNSVMDAEREVGANHSNIAKCCRGKQSSAGGFKWRYAI